MFVTFYSYKGGVGRSMALANIACLLAEDREHPQQVLLWDFDLEAPGLHKLLPPAESFRRGFVDLAFEFAQHGCMPDPADFVYKSELDGVDVLPAGRVDESYCGKLERIDWLGFFGDEPTEKGAFFEELTSWMRTNPHQHHQGYDYVLIDSRTGLNDVAGICTQVLPDIVLFIFRLTDQNLDGIEHLVPAIRAQLETRQRPEVELFPVASVVPSQSSESLDTRRKRAASMFDIKMRDLSYVRFDSDLIAEEKLFCRRDVESKMWPVPPIIDNYEHLCATIRRKNDQDTLTTAKLLDSAMRDRDYASARTALRPLLIRRPNIARTWRHLRVLSKQTRDGTKLGDQLANEILNSSKENIFALEWMASKCAADAAAADDANLNSAREFLEKAAAIAPDRLMFQRQLAELASVVGDTKKAELALKKCHELSPDNVQIRVDLANLYVRMGQDYFVDALKVLDQCETDIAEPLAIYLWTFLGNEEKAQHAMRDCRKTMPRLSQDWHYAQLVEAHRLLLKGEIDSAKQIAKQCIESSEQPPDPGAVANWAELFLCAEDFGGVSHLLCATQEDHKGDEDEQHGLCVLSGFLEGKGCVNESDVLKAWDSGPWSFTELLFFRERLRRADNNPYGNRLDIIENLIRQNALSSYRVQAEGSIFWRRVARGWQDIAAKRVSVRINLEP